MTNLPKILIRKKPKIIKFSFGQDFYHVFEKIEGKFENCFLLESLSQGPESRYSIIGFNPEKIIRASKNRLKIGKKAYKVKNPYESLREIFPQDVLSANFAGGLVGYLSYEAAEYFEPALKLKQNKDFGQFSFGLYTDGLVHDKTTGETFYFYYRKNRLPQILNLVKKGKAETSIHPKIKFKGFNIGEDSHKAIINSVKKEIIKGNTFQCQVGIRANYEVKGQALPIYEELRKLNPSPHMYYMKFGKKVILGASPELLFDLKNGEMQTFPLAGTIKRGKDENEDRLLAKKLVNDPKERAEHFMLVDLHRNDLGKVSSFGSVKVRRFLGVKKFSHVQHLSSEISALIAPGEDMFTALASCFPAGTLSGAPKIESMKIINNNEKQARGPYGGAVGFFGFNGNCTFAIPIRSLFISGQKAYAQASGGIVYDSNAKDEYLEVQNKLRALDIVLKKFI